MQVGTFLNGGPAFSYVQDFPEIDLGQADLDSGSIFTGNLTDTVFNRYGDTTVDFVNGVFDRFGIILNGDGADARVYFDNITIAPISQVPEPTTAGLVGLGLCGLILRRRR